MVQGGRGASFAAKAFERLLVLSEIFRRKFQGDESTKLGVLSVVDDTHPAAAELLDDPVVRDGLPDIPGMRFSRPFAPCFARLVVVSDVYLLTSVYCGSPIRRSRSEKRGSERMESHVGLTLMKFKPKYAS
jgi:hypothetical protein